jgi:hypothetical protein
MFSCGRKMRKVSEDVTNLPGHFEVTTRLICIGLSDAGHDFRGCGPT